MFVIGDTVDGWKRGVCTDVGQDAVAAVRAGDVAAAVGMPVEYRAIVQVPVLLHHILAGLEEAEVFRSDILTAPLNVGQSHVTAYRTTVRGWVSAYRVCEARLDSHAQR